MKNLFKNLMLVAVAAMAFAACSQDVNEVNKVEKKTVISGVLNIENDDTRSGFVGKNEAGNAYVSEWDGGESIRLYFSGGFSNYAEVDAKGNFEIDYIGDLGSGATVTICSPSDAWNNVNTFEIPSEQTPLANSVDPAAHILKSGATEIVNNTIWATMNHVAAYGKLTIKDAIDIEKVDVVLVGQYIEQSASMTLYADNVENNVFWFTTVPISWVKSFTIIAYEKETGVEYTKTVENLPFNDGDNQGLVFTTGRVSTFSVSGLKKQEAGNAMTSASVTSTGSNSNGDSLYEITFTNGDVKIVAKVNTKGNNYLNEMMYSSSLPWEEEGYIDSFSWTGVTTPWPNNMNVEIVDRVYSITFTTTDYGNGYKPYEATFKGAIEGLGFPDTRDRLATPIITVTASETEPTITVTWEAVANAIRYDVVLNDTTTYSTTECSYTISDLSWNKNYTVSVIAVADEASEVYRNSNAATEKVKTVADPNAPEVSDLFVEVVQIEGPLSCGYIGLDFTDANGVILYVEFNLVDGSSVPGTYTGQGWYSSTFWKVYYRNNDAAGDFDFDNSTLVVEDEGSDYLFTFDFKFANHSFTGTQTVSKSILY